MVPLIKQFNILLLGLGLCHQCSNDPLMNAEMATKPYTNFLYATNASLPGRIYMTINKDDFKTCINTVTSFYNKYNTCSNCEDFVKSPEKWNFYKVDIPKIGDIIIQHDKTGKAYHAVILVDIKGSTYYVNHAVKQNYYKRVILKNKNHLSFYRYSRH